MRTLVTAITALAAVLVSTSAYAVSLSHTQSTTTGHSSQYVNGQTFSHGKTIGHKVVGKLGGSGGSIKFENTVSRNQSNGNFNQTTTGSMYESSQVSVNGNIASGFSTRTSHSNTVGSSTVNSRDHLKTRFHEFSFSDGGGLSHQSGYNKERTTATVVGSFTESTNSFTNSSFVD